MSNHDRTNVGVTNHGAIMAGARSPTTWILEGIISLEVSTYGVTVWVLRYANDYYRAVAERRKGNDFCYVSTL